MTIPAPECIPIQPPPPPLRLRLPGGIEIVGAPISPSGIVSELLNVQSMLLAAMPAIAGIMPVMNIINAVIAIKDTIVAVPLLFVGDIQGFTDALEKLFEAMAAVGAMVPQLSIPVMAFDIIAIIAAALRVMETQLETAVGMIEQATALAEQGESMIPPNPDLILAAVCLEQQAEGLLAHTIAALGPIATIIGIVQLLMDLVPGLPALPELGDLSGEALDDALEAIRAFRELIEAIEIPGVQ